LVPAPRSPEISRHFANLSGLSASDLAAPALLHRKEAGVSDFLTIWPCRITISVAKEHLERPVKTAVNTSAPGKRPVCGLGLSTVGAGFCVRQLG
jgi:hypothetical protein